MSGFVLNLIDEQGGQLLISMTVVVQCGGLTYRS